MWPGGAFGRRGRIPPDEMAQPGRVLAHADAPEWTETLTAAQRGDAAALDDLTQAAVAVLGPWGRESGIRPDQIWSLQLTGNTLAPISRTRSAVSASGPARRWRCPGGAPMTPTGDRGRVLARRDYSAGPADEPPSGRCCSSSTRPGLAGRSPSLPLLREAGASAVLPLVIHRSV